MARRRTRLIPVPIESVKALSIGWYAWVRIANDASRRAWGLTEASARRRALRKWRR